MSDNATNAVIDGATISVYHPFYGHSTVTLDVTNDPVLLAALMEAWQRQFATLTKTVASGDPGFVA